MADFLFVYRGGDQDLEDMSPIYVLNRALARSEGGDSERALRELEELASGGVLEDYLLLECARGRVLEAIGRSHEAVASYRAAHARCGAEHERRLLERKIERLA